ncbi:VTT domain-containing protein [uncultured Methanolobus sp.]|uniref:VTT domain-containing protein n=1 Tax=uncultured Methanolobus sp. TaxID=218300 RepID=UPI002AABC0FD|nr:VTT domain-containing protein [uncultured Methanolobus sp.]
MQEKSENNASLGDETETCPLSNENGTMRPVIFIVLFIVSWSVLLYYYSPEDIVNFIGIENVYAFIFLIALVGGVSTFTSTTFYTALITISLGGVNTITVALLASIGLTIGDLLFYYLGSQSKKCIKERYESKINGFVSYMERTGDTIVMFLIFLYSLAPLPSDILAIALAIVEFPFKKMIVPLLIGNFTLIVALVELSKLGYNLV